MHNFNLALSNMDKQAEEGGKEQTSCHYGQQQRHRGLQHQ